MQSKHEDGDDPVGLYPELLVWIEPQVDPSEMAAVLPWRVKLVAAFYHKFRVIINRFSVMSSCWDQTL